MELAYYTLLAEDLEPRGFAFWNILDEGKVPPVGDYIHDIDIKDSDSISSVKNGEDENIADKTEDETENDTENKLVNKTVNEIENKRENKTKESLPLWLAGSLNKFMKIRK